MPIVRTDDEPRQLREDLRNGGRRLQGSRNVPRLGRAAPDRDVHPKRRVGTRAPASARRSQGGRARPSRHTAGRGDPERVAPRRLARYAVERPRPPRAPPSVAYVARKGAGRGTVPLPGDRYAEGGQSPFLRTATRKGDSPPSVAL